MATFYPSSTNQRDAMANLYMRDPAGNALYPESAIPGNMVYLNYSPYGPYSETLAGSSQSQGIRFTDLVTSHLGENAYNSWRDGRNEMLFMQANGESMDGEDEIIRNSVTDDPQISLQTQLGILNGHNLPLQQSNISNVQGQGLSLSLGTQIPVPSFKYQVVSSSHQSSPGNGETYSDEQYRSRILNASASSYGLTNIASIIPNSKYLKTAQQLLDEVVSIQKVLKQKTDKAHSFNTSDTTACKENDGGAMSDGNPSNNLESAGNPSIEISPSERQELQNKLTKLLAMLDEVDRRYKQYYHQMQIVVSSFDSIAGAGAAKPYTALALQTISRHFRCLRDAIGDQVRCTRKSLGEQDGSSGKGCGISRLRYIDQHIRQQRAIQQLGVMPQHAWRPQRGLPENSVTVLRAWLFEHFLHPYPNDSEKLILARQTGLTRSQVSNWFINARVRLWKPMVEDMYKEEFGETEMDANSSSDNATKCMDELQSFDARDDQPCSAAETCQTNQSSRSQKPDPSSETRTAGGALDFQSTPTGQRPHDLAGISVLHNIIRDADGSSRFMSYPMTELGRYGGVSLTLGLQHCDGNLPDSDGQPGFLAVRGDEEEMYNAAPSLGFGPSQLLHDFVA